MAVSFYLFVKFKIKYPPEICSSQQDLSYRNFNGQIKVRVLPIDVFFAVFGPKFP